MRQLFALNAIIRGIRARRLSAADCRLLLSVGIVQLLARASVAWTSIATTRRMLSKVRWAALSLRGVSSETRVIWAIEAAGWRMAGSSCLARALTAELLLPPVNRPLTVVIGVARPIAGRLKSHAWIERDGEVLVGGRESGEQYVPLVAWSGAAR